MGDMLARGQAWLAAQQKTHASRPVVYRRGGASVTLDATIGKTDFEYTDGYGATIIDQSRDYLIHAADLVLGGERTLPLSGDTIEETDGGETLRVRGNRPWPRAGLSLQRHRPSPFANPYQALDDGKPMSRTGDLLDAVATELNTVVWGEPVTIGKAYLPEVDRRNWRRSTWRWLFSRWPWRHCPAVPAGGSTRWTWGCRNGLTPRTGRD